MRGRSGRSTLGNRKRRQESAKRLQEEATQRTPEQQLARLNAGGWRAEKERAKLKIRIAKRKEAA